MISKAIVGVVEVPLPALCGTIPGQFRNYQIHFVRQHFGSPGKVVHFAGHTKLPSMMAISHRFT